MLNGAKAHPEVDVQIGGKTFKLRFGVRAFILVEEKTGKSISQILEDTSLSTLTTTICAALQKHHPEVTLEDLREEIDFSDILQIRSLIGKAVMNASPPDDGKKKGTKEEI